MGLGARLRRFRSSTRVAISVASFAAAVAPRAFAQPSPAPAAPAVAPAEATPPASPVTPAAQVATPPPSDDIVQSARRAYDEGSAHYVAGRYSEALLSFERAYNLRPNPVVLLPVVECHDRLGHIPEAIRALEMYLQGQPQARNRPLLETRLENLRRRPGRLHVLTVPPGAAITVDGRNVAHVAPTDVELSPGLHTLVFTLRDHLSATREIDVLPGISRDELVSLERDPASNMSGGASQSQVLGASPPSRGTSAAVWVSIGLAGAALAAGTAFGVLALTENNLYDRSPSLETRERGLRYALISDVSFGVAAGAAVVAVVMYFVDRNRTPAERRAAGSVRVGAGDLVVRF